MRTKIKNKIKRLMDCFIVLLVSPLLLPCFIFLGLGIFLEQVLRRDFGPVIIYEPRVSQGRTFPLYKLNMFRETARRKYVNESPDYQREKTYSYLQHDPSSLSSIGKIVKKFCLDEIPQSFNILRGEMSVVGPRPKPEVLALNSLPPRQLLKTGIFCFENNYNKNLGHTILNYKTDDEYLDFFQNLSVPRLLKLEFFIIIDGIRAILKGKGL